MITIQQDELRKRLDGYDGLEEWELGFIRSLNPKGSEKITGELVCKVV